VTLDFIYMNVAEKAISAILMQNDDQNNEKLVAYMSHSLSNDEIKYSYIEKHDFSLVKAVEKFIHFILGKNMQVKVPFHAVKFLLSQTHISSKLAHWLAKIQEKYLTIMISKMIKGRDLALYLDQHLEQSEFSEDEDSLLSALFYIENQNLNLS
jgi:hypothetical protein